MIKLRQTINERLKLWNETIAGARSQKVGLRLLREREQWRCKNDLFYLCCKCGWKEIEKYPAFYEPFCDEVSLMNWQVVKHNIHKPSPDLLDISEVTDNPEEDLKFLQRLYLCYRTFYKTTIITKVHSLQLILNFPNIHIIVCHNIFNNASANVVSVKQMFLSPYIQRHFPEYVPNTKDWGNRFGFSVANRRDKGRDEENIMAAGVDTEITGGHWQIAKKNDLVTEDSVNTEEQIKKTLDWDDRFNIGHFDSPDVNLQDYEGTRYHQIDLYSLKKRSANIKIIEKPLLRDSNDLSSAIHPERFTEEAVRRIKEDKKPWVFMCQMQQKPEDPSKTEFTPEMIAYYDKLPDFHSCNYYLLIDPASSRKKKADYTVMTVVGVGYGNKKFIADCVRDKLDPKKRVDRAIELAKKWRIKGCGWEAIAFQSTDCYYFEEARRKEQLRFLITEIKSQTVSKTDRIRGLIPEYTKGEWLWPEKGRLVRFREFTGRNYDVTEELEQELLFFPLAEHDDLLDTQTFLKQIDVLVPKRESNIGLSSHEMTFGEYAKTIDLRKQKPRDPYQHLIESRV